MTGDPIPGRATGMPGYSGGRSAGHGVRPPVCGPALHAAASCIRPLPERRQARPIAASSVAITRTPASMRSAAIDE